MRFQVFFLLPHKCHLHHRLKQQSEAVQNILNGYLAYAASDPSTNVESNIVLAVIDFSLVIIS